MKNNTKKVLGVAGAIILGHLVLSGVENAIFSDNVLHYNPEQRVVVENKNQEQKITTDELLKQEKEYMHDRIAFCIQKSQVAFDEPIRGSIQAPYFFGQLSQDMRNLIVFIKDQNPELLEAYLKRDISKNLPRLEAEFKQVIINAQTVEINANILKQQQR